METPSHDLLSIWQSYLTNISSNLMELSDQTEYQLIKSKLRDNTLGYTGMTREKAQGCVETVGDLWRYYALLSEVLEKAAALNSRRSLLYNPDGDIRDLLEESQIVIDTEHVDINSRSLLGKDVIEKKSTPKKLLTSMQESFEGICRDVEEIIKSEDAVQDRLSSMKKDISRLNATLKSIGVANIPEFDTGRISKVESDPLQGMQELDKLVYSIEKYRASIAAVEEEYNEVFKELKKIREMLVELKDLLVRSKRAAIEAQSVFGNEEVAKPAASEEIIKSLEDWLCVLENKLERGGLKAVKVGALRLETECLQKLEEERKNYDKNRGSYNEWLDLKGQFGALLVKADILRAKGLLIDNSLNELLEKTNAALNSKPVKLGSCRELVRKFESSL